MFANSVAIEKIISHKDSYIYIFYSNILAKIYAFNLLHTCKALWLSAMVSAASLNALDAFCSPSAAIT